MVRAPSRTKERRPDTHRHIAKAERGKVAVFCSFRVLRLSQLIPRRLSLEPFGSWNRSRGWPGHRSITSIRPGPPAPCCGTALGTAPRCSLARCVMLTSAGRGPASSTAKRSSITNSSRPPGSAAFVASWMLPRQRLGKDPLQGPRGCLEGL